MDIPTHSITAFDDGKRALCHVYNKVTLWNLDITSIIKEIVGHSGLTTFSKLFKNNTRLLTGSQDQTLKIWDIPNLNHIITLKGHKHCVTAADIYIKDDDDDQYKVISGDIFGNMYLWKIDEKVRSAKKYIEFYCGFKVNYLEFMDKKTIISCMDDTRVCIWDKDKAKQLEFYYESSEPVIQFGEFSRDSKIVKYFKDLEIVITVRNNEIHIWSDDGVYMDSLKGHSDKIVIIEEAKNNHHMLSSSEDGTIRYWDLEKFSCAKIYNFNADSITVHENEDCFSACTLDRKVRIVEISSGNTLQLINIPTSSSETNVYSPGRRSRNTSRTPPNARAHHDMYYRIEEIEDSKSSLMENMQRVIDKFVPKEFRTLLSSGYGMCKLGDAICKITTIMFTDIRDFTSLSEKLSVNSLIKFLNVYLAFTIPPIYEYGGFVDKFIGDSVMSLFSSDDLSEQVDNALLAAVKIQKDLRFMQRHGINQSITTGIGINTGRTIIGWVGTETRMEPTVLGDSVNISSRMESLCKIYGSSIIITEHTKIRVGRRTEIMTFRLLDHVVVKGKTVPCEIYEVIDGDQDDIRKLKKRMIKSGFWDEALRLYKQYKFLEAKEMFLHCLNIYTEDKPSKIYIERCEKEIARKDSFDPKKWQPIVYLESK